MPKSEPALYQRLIKHRSLHDRRFLLLAFANVFLVLTILVVLFVRIESKDFAVTLRFSTINGIEDTGEWYQIYAVGVFSVIVTTLNLFIAGLMHLKSKFVSYLILSGTAMIMILTLFVANVLISNTPV